MLDPSASPTPSPTSTLSLAQLQAQFGANVPPPAGTGGAVSAGAQAEPLIYAGSYTHTSSRAGNYEYNPHTWAGQPVTTDKTYTLTQAMKKFDKLSAAQQHNMYRLLLIAGFAGGSPSLDKVDEYVKESTQGDVREAYFNLLQTANDVYQNGHMLKTPEDILKEQVAYRLSGEGVKWDGKLSSLDDGVTDYLKSAGIDTGSTIPKGGTYTTKSTSTTVDLMNPMDAKNMTRGMLQKQLGRDPTQAEYEDFLAAVNAAEHANPTTTSSTTTDTYGLDNNQNLRLTNSHTSNTSHQGIGAQGIEQLMYEKAISNPSWAEWQAMGTYAPALFASLGSSVPGV